MPSPKRHDGWTERLWGLIDSVRDKKRGSLLTTNSNESLFGESLVAARTPIIELNSSYGLSRLRDAVTETGSGTVSDTASTQTGEFLLSSGTTTGSRARLESAEIGRYIPGYSAELGVGIRFEALPEGDQEIRWGGEGSDGQNGYYFGYDSGGVFVARCRDGTVLSKTYQQDWNIDKLDGTGRSGHSLDLTRGYIYQVDFSWYGYGAVRFGVLITLNGRQSFIVCHIMQDFDSGTSVVSPNLRVCINVGNNTTATDTQVYVGGRQYSIVGNYIPKYRFTADFRGDTNTSTTVVPLVSFRRKTGFGDRSIKLEGYDTLVASEPVYLEIRIGGTLTGETWETPTDYSADETALEADTSATAITGGDVVWGQLAAAGQNKNSAQLAAAQVDFDIPNGDIVTLCARTVTGTGSIISALRMREEW
jgi:hypothetical protein